MRNMKSVRSHSLTRSHSWLTIYFLCSVQDSQSIVFSYPFCIKSWFLKTPRNEQGQHSFTSHRWNSPGRCTADKGLACDHSVKRYQNLAWPKANLMPSAVLHHLQQPQPRGGVTSLFGKEKPTQLIIGTQDSRPGIKTSVHSWRFLLWPAQCLCGLLMSQLPMFKYWEILYHNPEWKL